MFNHASKRADFSYIPSASAVRIMKARKRYARNVLIGTLVRYSFIAIGCYAVVVGLCMMGA